MNTAVSSAPLYWENRLAFFAPKGVAIPDCSECFPDELYQAPKSWAEKAYPKLVITIVSTKADTLRLGSNRSLLLTKCGPRSNRCTPANATSATAAPNK